MAVPSFGLPIRRLVLWQGVLVRSFRCRYVRSVVLKVLRKVSEVLSRAQVVQILVPEDVLLQLIQVPSVARICTSDFFHVLLRSGQTMRERDRELWPQELCRPCAADHVEPEEAAVAHAQANVP